MPSVDPNLLRQRFLDFFVERFRQHAGNQNIPRETLIPNGNATGSSSLQPPDASTLFTSAGMHQFKDDFQGNLVHGTRAAATVQKCMRTPDLENVGKTARHHTFFEMLGFFSFGDGLSGPNGSKGFFKKEAIRWIWDFYTLPWDKGGCGLDKSKLYVSVYGGDENGKDRDEEAAGIWRPILGEVWPKAEVEKRIFWLGENDNFWPAGAPSSGPNGVCGPCSEIFYDLGDEYGQGDVATNGARFMEIGNIVFTQYERSGPTPGKGTLTPLPAKNIDFGGGFERLVMVLDGAPTTLDCGLFEEVRRALRNERLTKLTQNTIEVLHEEYTFVCAASAIAGNAVRAWEIFKDPQTVLWSQRSELQGRFAAVKANDPSTRDQDTLNWLASKYDDYQVREKRIADHIRAVTFAMADGILPSNEGAGYVIRRIIRRAFRDGSALGFDGPFLHKLVPVVVEHYGDAYPELRLNTKGIVSTLQQEEQQFSTTLERGLQLLAGLIREHKARDDKTLDGKAAFDLYQSQGLPREVVQDELAAEGMLLDVHGYDEAERKHRLASKGGKEVVVFEKGWFQDVKAKTGPTQFLGYDTCDAQARVIALVRDGKLFDIIEQGDTATVILDRTPFYGESGGQVGDRGSLIVGESSFEVADTLKRDDYFLHEGKVLHGKLRVGDTVQARVDAQRRDRIRANHSATHLMHAALREVLGDHVVQRGSEVGPDRLRFDFSHPKGLSFEERQRIEQLVNEQVRANAEVSTQVMAPEAAQKAGAMALFGEKYGDKVRVLSMGKDRGTGVPPDETGRGAVNRRQGAYLPHWEAKHATYFVTFRVADSLPESARLQILAEREQIVGRAEQLGAELTELQRERLLALHTEKIDALLGAGHGSCPFNDDRCATVVADALRHFDGKRYKLYAWCVMPNHVHVVVKPFGDFSLPDILHSWKSFTAKECNRLLGHTGEFWMAESFDRLIRNDPEFNRFVRYTIENPTAAGLRNWKWTGQSSDDSVAGSEGETPSALTGGDARATHVRPFSMELCGGTHVARTGDIGLFRIVSEGSSSAGVRRIEAVTGADAYELAAADARLLAELHALTKAQPGKVKEKVESLLKEVKELKSKPKAASAPGAGVDAIRKSGETVGEFTLYAAEVPGAEAADLLTIRDTLGQDARPMAVLLGSRGEGRALLLLSFTKELVGKGLHAGKLVGEIAQLVGGKGGGKPDTAQAGGKDPDKLPEALEAGKAKIRQALSKA